MRIQPAHADQVQRAMDGRMVLISSDAGGVADDLRRIDPGLKVRFAENGKPPFWAIYHESEDGRDTHLVTTAQAWQSSTGAWLGLDHRIVERVLQVDAKRGYNYAAELEQQNLRVKEARRYEARERLGELAERAAHAARKDLGDTSRISVHKKA